MNQQINKGKDSLRVSGINTAAESQGVSETRSLGSNSAQKISTKYEMKESLFSEGGDRKRIKRAIRPGLARLSSLKSSKFAQMVKQQKMGEMAKNDSIVLKNNQKSTELVAESPQDPSNSQKRQKKRKIKKHHSIVNKCLPRNLGGREDLKFVGIYIPSKKQIHRKREIFKFEDSPKNSQLPKLEGLKPFSAQQSQKSRFVADSPSTKAKRRERRARSHLRIRKSTNFSNAQKSEIYDRNDDRIMDRVKSSYQHGENSLPVIRKITRDASMRLKKVQKRRKRKIGSIHSFDLKELRSRQLRFLTNFKEYKKGGEAQEELLNAIQQKMGQGTILGLLDPEGALAKRRVNSKTSLLAAESSSGTENLSNTKKLILPKIQKNRRSMSREASILVSSPKENRESSKGGLEIRGRSQNRKIDHTRSFDGNIDNELNKAVSEFSVTPKNLQKRLKIRMEAKFGNMSGGPNLSDSFNSLETRDGTRETPLVEKSLFIRKKHKKGKKRVSRKILFQEGKEEMERLNQSLKMIF